MTNHPPSLFQHCWLGHQTCKNIIFDVTYIVSSVTSNLTSCRLNLTIMLELVYVATLKCCCKSINPEISEEA